MLQHKTPREQIGRDTFARYRAQARSAAFAALELLEDGDVDRVYCDVHDDFVVRINDSKTLCYIFYQVKTKSKGNRNWSTNELFGITQKQKKKNEETPTKIEKSHVGKMLVHAMIFGSHCRAMVFQTNVHLDDTVEAIQEDIKSGQFKDSRIVVFLEAFSEGFSKYNDHLPVAPDEARGYLSKLRFEVDLPQLKPGNPYFESIAKHKIYEYSEIDLTIGEAKDILVKLLELVQRKSEGVIAKWTERDIERHAGITLEDVLGVLSITEDTYRSLKRGGDNAAIKSASIIQRTLSAGGASEDLITFCSRCKVRWDQWLRKNRHVLPEYEILALQSRIAKVLRDAHFNGALDFLKLQGPIEDLLARLHDEALAYDLSNELLLGGVFAEPVRGQA